MYNYVYSSESMNISIYEGLLQKFFARPLSQIWRHWNTDFKKGAENFSAPARKLVLASTWSRFLVIISLILEFDFHFWLPCFWTGTQQNIRLLYIIRTLCVFAALLKFDVIKPFSVGPLEKERNERLFWLFSVVFPTYFFFFWMTCLYRR